MTSKSYTNLQMSCKLDCATDYFTTRDEDRMIYFKRISAVLLSALLTASMLIGCDIHSKEINGGNDGTINIVCTVFPQYDWVRQIVGDNGYKFNIKLLSSNGTDLHSYQPTASDMITISNADLFVYVGGESDEWVEDALEDSVNLNRRVINLMRTLGDSVKEEEIVEGMQESDHDDHDDIDDIEYDEHVWLSLKNAKFFCEEITAKLIEIDENNADIYSENSKKYIDKLESLDEEYKTTVDNANKKVLLFGDRFPFRYLTDDYGISYYAAFVGCSAETNASFETITFLAEKVDKLELSSVVVLDGSSKKIAETIINNTKNKNQKILMLNSMQSVTSVDIDNGNDYISIMQKNLEVIKTALS